MILRELATIPLPTLKSRSPALKEPQILWLNSSDETPLAVRQWVGQQGRPVLVYLHGIEGHGAWFEHSGAVFNSFGLSVYAPDRRGAGLNKPDRGHMPSHQALLGDIELLLQFIQLEHPGSKVIMFGNCWGAKPAAVISSSNYKPVNSTFSVPLAGLVMTCPALFTRVDLRFAEKIGIGFDIIRSFNPDARFDRRHIDIPIDVEMFTDNREYIEYIKNDPFRLKSATSRFFFENFVLSIKAAAAAKTLDLPFFLIQTDKDEIVNFEKVQDWYRRIPEGKKSLKVFQEGSHSIDFDTRWYTQYITSVMQWVDKVAAG